MLFFFSSRRRHTRLQGDWSSDVCSSDLGWNAAAARASRGGGAGGWSLRLGSLDRAVEDVRDVGALDDQARLAALYGDLVILQVHDLADDTARGDDAVAALQRGEQLAVPLLLPALGADQHEVEDRDQGADLDQEDGHSAAGTLAGGSEQQGEHSVRGHADPVCR